ncbi:MAG: CoA ester lyase [Anaerolineae bacterium]
MRIRRALLFMPGDDRRKIEKGASLSVDSIIMDLEDGVALNNKAAARATIAAALREVDFGRSEKLVRINPASSDFYVDDIEGTIHAAPDGYVVPKVEHGRQVQEISSRLLAAEHNHGWEEGTLALLAIIETPMGIVNLREIASSDPRLSALIFGAEDMAGAMGAIRTPDGWEVFYARSKVVLHAKAFGMQAIDTPFVSLADADMDNLIAETEQALYMGYDGKLAIHPKQIEPIQRVFTPTAEQIEQAKRLVAAHDEHQRNGTGVFAFEGRMVDMPIVRAAERVLARAAAAGMDV